MLPADGGNEAKQAIFWPNRFAVQVNWIGRLVAARASLPLRQQQARPNHSGFAINMNENRGFSPVNALLAINAGLHLINTAKRWAILANLAKVAPGLGVVRCRDASATRAL